MEKYLKVISIYFYVACCIIDTTAYLYENKYFNATTAQFDITNAQNIYKDFIKKYNRKFRDEDEYYERYLNFVATLRTINNQNAGLNEKVGPNEFADWSDDERRERIEKMKKPVSMDPELKYLQDSKKHIQVDLVLPGTDEYMKMVRAKNLPIQVATHLYGRRRLFS